MKRVLLFLFCIIIYAPGYLQAKNEIDSLLKVLDKTISERAMYTHQKILRIDSLKSKLNNDLSLKEVFRINETIINEYESFLCDSAVLYIDKNIEIADILDDKELSDQSKLHYSFVLSLSGLFIQAQEVMSSITFKELPVHLKMMYCWTYIRYYENLIKYTDDIKYKDKYLLEKMYYRNTIMSFLDEKSEMYLKEEAFKLQDERKYEEACKILTEVFSNQKPYTHVYAMSAMSLAKTYEYLKNAEPLENKYLAIAAITDIRLAVKENEALLALAINLYNKGDVKRGYNYIKVALDDANFYNSRFKNTVIARIQPIIENTYLTQIEQQKQNLRLYAILISIFVVFLFVALFFIYKQIKTVSRARRNLKVMNEKLANINRKLDESNLIKEKYMGYFMNQCAIYIDKLEEYRKKIDRKIKTGHIEDLYNLIPSTRMEDVEELHRTFDKAFFKIYPNFVEEFNALLKENDRYKLEKGQLNTELRIFALIRLGITDVNQIAVFLHYSHQTIYNYKSKVKGKAIIESENFEEEVKKIGIFLL
ncbi:MAG: DUF6377 domain-containing protein [Prevotella sp.]|jgi:hypothetical protein|nr:DUF6377 domain-containing protein [Prevotella sp.]